MISVQHRLKRWADMNISRCKTLTMHLRLLAIHAVYFFALVLYYIPFFIILQISAIFHLENDAHLDILIFTSPLYSVTFTNLRFEIVISDAGVSKSSICPIEI